jgi:putative transposase
MEKQMQLVERHIVTKYDKNYKEIDRLSFLSKNLYNYCNYLLRNQYFKNQKLEKKDRIYIHEYDLTTKLGKEKQLDFMALPSNTSQQIIHVLFKNWKSFYKLCLTKNFQGKPKIPKYKDKTKGRNIVVFTINQAKLKNRFITFPKVKCNLEPIHTKVTNICQVRIVPQCGCYVIEVVYKKEKKQNENLKENIYLGIDLGINNFATLVTNSENVKPVLVNGNTIKSINQYYNKKQALLKSYIGNKGTSNHLKRLHLKRNNKVNDYMHKVSRYVINYCIQYNIKNIVIGYNKDWKQKINLGKVTNQKFTNIPYLKFLNQVKYKAELENINFLTHEESYTSKVDHLAYEKLCKHKEYLGKRIKRGLFQSSIGKLINADVNGAIGILRKVIGDGFLRNLINTGCGYQPVRLSIV